MAAKTGREEPAFWIETLLVPWKELKLFLIEGEIIVNHCVITLMEL